MAQIWPHYTSARLEVTGIVHCRTPSVPASPLHTHKELLKQLEYELWNRLPQVLIRLFPSYSPDVLPDEFIFQIHLLFQSEIRPVPCQFPHQSMQTPSLNHLWQVSYHKTCTGQAVGCAMATADPSSSSCHLMFSSPEAVTLPCSLPYRTVRRHSALVLCSFALQCLWTYWNCQHYWIWYLWHTSSSCKKRKKNNSWQVLPILLFTLMHIHLNLYRNASIYRGKICISSPQKV